MFSKTRTVGVLTARAAAVTATVIAGLALIPMGTASAKPIVTDYYIEVANCQGRSQFCPINPADAPSVTFNNGLFPPVVEFFANPNHCSDGIAHIFYDGVEWGSNVVSPGGSDGGYEIDNGQRLSGSHTVAVQMEGWPNGCNTGYIGAWGGTLRITVQGTLN